MHNWNNIRGNFAHFENTVNARGNLTRHIDDFNMDGNFNVDIENGPAFREHDAQQNPIDNLRSVSGNEILDKLLQMLKQKGCHLSSTRVLKELIENKGVTSILEQAIEKVAERIVASSNVLSGEELNSGIVFAESFYSKLSSEDKTAALFRPVKIFTSELDVGARPNGTRIRQQAPIMRAVHSDYNIKFNQCVSMENNKMATSPSEQDVDTLCRGLPRDLTGVVKRAFTCKYRDNIMFDGDSIAFKMSRFVHVYFHTGNGTSNDAYVNGNGTPNDAYVNGNGTFTPEDATAAIDILFPNPNMICILQEGLFIRYGSAQDGDDTGFYVSRQIFKSPGDILFSRVEACHSCGVDYTGVYLTPRGLYYKIYGTDIFDYMKIPQNGIVPRGDITEFIENTFGRHNTDISRHRTQRMQRMQRHTPEDMAILCVLEYITTGGINTPLGEQLYRELVCAAHAEPETIKKLRAKQPMDFKVLYRAFIDPIYCRKTFEQLEHRMPPQLYNPLLAEYNNCIMTGAIFPTETANEIIAEIIKYYEKKYTADLAELCGMWKAPRNVGLVETPYYKNADAFHAPFKGQRVSLGLKWDTCRLLILGARDRGSALYGLPRDILHKIVHTYNVMFHIGPVTQHLKQFISNANECDVHCPEGDYDGDALSYDEMAGLTQWAEGF